MVVFGGLDSNCLDRLSIIKELMNEFFIKIYYPKREVNLKAEALDSNLSKREPL